MSVSTQPDFGTNFIIHPVSFGLLYNGYVVDDSRNIANVGWHIPTESDLQTFYTYISGTEIEKSNKVCEPSLLYWSQILSATNELNFNGRGAGARSGSNGEFSGIKGGLSLLSSTIGAVDTHITLLISLGQQFNNGWTNNKSGYSIRLIKDTTSLSHGQQSSYIGNDNKMYLTICIGTQEWLAGNICETKYRNGDAITEVTSNSTWIGLTTGALCAYSNDWNNV